MPLMMMMMNRSGTHLHPTSSPPAPCLLIPPSTANLHHTKLPHAGHHHANAANDLLSHGARDSYRRMKVHVVYYLSRNHGQLIDQPHLLEGYVHLMNAGAVAGAEEHGIRLRDFKKSLAALRGKTMPDAFAWSYKRRYKSGFIWHDLGGDDDIILPLHQQQPGRSSSDGFHEYVLKGSELILLPPPAPAPPSAPPLQLLNSPTIAAATSPSPSLIITRTGAKCHGDGTACHKKLMDHALGSYYSTALRHQNTDVGTQTGDSGRCSIDHDHDHDQQARAASLIHKDGALELDDDRLSIRAQALDRNSPMDNCGYNNYMAGDPSISSLSSSCNHDRSHHDQSHTVKGSCSASNSTYMALARGGGGGGGRRRRRRRRGSNCSKYSSDSSSDGSGGGSNSVLALGEALANIHLSQEFNQPGTNHSGSRNQKSILTTEDLQDLGRSSTSRSGADQKYMNAATHHILHHSSSANEREILFDESEYCNGPSSGHASNGGAATVLNRHSCKRSGYNGAARLRAASNPRAAGHVRAHGHGAMLKHLLACGNAPDVMRKSEHEGTGPCASSYSNSNNGSFDGGLDSSSTPRSVNSSSSCRSGRCNNVDAAKYHAFLPHSKRSVGVVRPPGSRSSSTSPYWKCNPRVLILLHSSTRRRTATPSHEIITASTFSDIDTRPSIRSSSACAANRMPHHGNADDLKYGSAIKVCIGDPTTSPARVMCRDDGTARNNLQSSCGPRHSPMLSVCSSSASRRSSMRECDTRDHQLQHVGVEGMLFKETFNGSSPRNGPETALAKPVVTLQESIMNEIRSNRLAIETTSHRSFSN